ncbi:MAG: anti-sigma F factor, partial [Candidatus Spyradocola sp.]
LAAELYGDGRAALEIVDCGVGIPDVEKAREPLYTSRPDMERSGMGFTVMETFMDSVSVQSRVGHGTTVRMEKRLGQAGAGKSGA